ncbi:MAG TPA: hypothetical protein VF498_06715 [Anaerolineales bacterium]
MNRPPAAQGRPRPANGRPNDAARPAASSAPPGSEHVDPKQSALRIPLLALGVLLLLAALWTGLIRLGWAWPHLLPLLPAYHGPLMVSGFLGTLVSLERAVALHKRWTYLAPLLSGLGGLALLVDRTGLVGPFLLTLGSLGLVALFGVILQRHFARYTAVMALGSLAWLAGNLLWLAGRPIYTIVLWWAAFLVLTIAGERLELGRLVRLSRLAEGLFLGAIGLFLAGLIWSVFALAPGVRLAGIGMLALGAWLLRYDIARRTLRKPGLPRFAAFCLLSGYLWLGFAGILALVYGAPVAGLRYDALLHAIFIGNIISMIFGHAPIIFPAILGLPISFDPFFYAPLGLLHFSLLLRIGGDLAGSQPARLWGGLLNAIAILLFLALVGLSLRRGLAKSRSQTML